MTNNFQFRRLVLGVVLFGATMDTSIACVICLPMPEKTTADFLIESQYVIFAREDPKQPFSYASVHVLKGQLEAPNTGLFVDSTTRKVLRTHPKRMALLVRKDKDSLWRSLGVADLNYQSVVRRILAISPDWHGALGAEKRLAFFLPLLKHDNRMLFELAYLELGRAPYSVVKRIAQFAAREDLYPILHRPEYFEWRSLAILLLAHQARPSDKAYIEENFRACSKFSIARNLSAWAAAHIELNGERALEQIEREYLANPNRTAEEVQAVLTALSIHGRDGQKQVTPADFTML